MNVPTVDPIADAVIDAFPKLSTLEQRVALVLYRLLARDRPASVEQISEASDVSRAEVAAMLAKWHGVQRSPNGAITAFWGLTLSNTKHRFRVDGRDLHTWCAWDTLFLPPLLGAKAEVESTCPASGARITLSVGPNGITAASPETAMVSFVVPRESDVERNLIEAFCCHVHFLSSAEAGAQWIAGRPGMLLLSLTDAWRIGIRKNSAQYSAVACQPRPARHSFLSSGPSEEAPHPGAEQVHGDDDRDHR